MANNWYLRSTYVDDTPDTYVGSFPTRRAAEKHWKDWGPHGAMIVVDTPDGASVMSPEDYIAGLG